MNTKVIKRLEICTKYAGLSNGTCVVNITDVQAVIQDLKNKEADLYSANQIISDQIETIKKQDKMIEDFISEIIRMIYYYENYKECKFDYEISENITETRENIRKYFEERCK